MEKSLKIAGYELSLKKEGAPALSKEETAQMLECFKAYRDAKEKIDRNIIENENWFKGNHWQYISGQSVNDTAFRPAGSFLLNGIWHRHAEAMENYPQPVFLEREEGDKRAAQMLSKIVPLILQKNRFKEVYSDIWWYKLKQGSGVYGIFWDNTLENGLGDIAIKKIDLLRFYCEPFVDNVQDSKYIFLLSVCSNDEAKKLYPNADIKKGSEISLKSYFGVKDLRDKVCVIDCYEKVKGEDGKTRVHLTKIIGDRAAYSTKTDPNFEKNGLYAHGMYPFVIDKMIPIEGSPFGMGIIDIGKNAQAQIDKLEYLIERNALISSRQRFLVKRDGGIDPEKLSDLSVDFIECDRNVDDTSIRPIQAKPLSDSIISCREKKIEELKEIIGNRDFSQGDTTKGVTAYAAISALQEAGSKLTRDGIEASYSSFSELMYLLIELISQFYSEERSFRITNEKGAEYLKIGGNKNGKFSACIFDIEVSPKKKNSFDALTHNELIMRLLESGAFEKEKKEAAISAVSAMVLDNKQSIIQSLK